MRYMCEKCGNELLPTVENNGRKVYMAKFFYGRMSCEPSFALCRDCEEEFKTWLGYAKLEPKR